MKQAKSILQKYIQRHNIRFSKQRMQILDIFLRARNHLTVTDLHLLVKEKYPNIGSATVYRAIKIIRASNLATEVDFGDGVKRFEHRYGNKLHSHLICSSCNKVIEFTNLNLNKMYLQIAKNYDFKLLDNRIQIIGVCKKCTKDKS